MRKSIRTLVLGVASALALVMGPVAFVAADQGNPQLDATKDFSTAALNCRRQSAANVTGQDIFLSTGDPRTYTGTTWQNVECGTTTFRLSYGQRALIVADASAELDCNGTAGQWCEARALLNGAEMTPVTAEPSSFAFDSTAGGASNWQAHSMNRGYEVRCALTAGCQYRFTLQTKMHATSVTGLWLDDLAVHLRISYGNPAPL